MDYFLYAYEPFLVQGSFAKSSYYYKLVESTPDTCCIYHRLRSFLITTESYIGTNLPCTKQHQAVFSRKARPVARHALDSRAAVL